MKEPLVWERLAIRNTPEQKGLQVYGVREVRRAKVPGGWLVATYMNIVADSGTSPASGGLTFYPDPNHTWNGASLS
jgi:hypothetical protein